MVREHHARSKLNTEMPEEFGFWFPEYITEIWNMVTILESFSMWPEKGSYLDQNAYLIDDILTMKKLKDYVRDQDKPKGDES